MPALHPVILKITPAFSLRLGAFRGNSKNTGGKDKTTDPLIVLFLLHILHSEILEVISVPLSLVS